ncbi:hypothetical protein FBY35_6157 [Streptomyces sp. SLBN-118]|uniref:hypothetical protein n=1 Tax=Streptomyces sp. SLBN-118 TaxID=2768454 RepID=UPI00116BD834|nr:hypothetical protein [Streptomyces sp. SLBN-118]TQK44641.1 hypothetical protein FBY35_6157 [Streptomyces sp. SLBN-118]
MPHRIAHIFEPLLWFILPIQGRHRRSNRRSIRDHMDAPAEGLPRVPVWPLRGEEIGIVRPYVVVRKLREARWKRARRRAQLWLAVQGIDIGPRLIHGVEVTA